MTGELVIVNVVMLVLSTTVGVAFAYMQRNVSPFAPRVRDYLETQHAAAADVHARRVA